jgi:hypothetical protein
LGSFASSQKELVEIQVRIQKKASEQAAPQAKAEILCTISGGPGTLRKKSYKTAFPMLYLIISFRCRAGKTSH